MLKKLLVGWVAIAMVLLVGINVVKGFKDNATDEYTMNAYIDEHYGEQCYGVLSDHRDDKYINFKVYENGECKSLTSINRDVYQSIYTEQLMLLFSFVLFTYPLMKKEVYVWLDIQFQVYWLVQRYMEVCI